jgi:DNA-binding transcriptional MocR family regulator
MPTEHKRELVKVAEKYNIPIIEDDVYGELSFDNHRPLTCKSFDESGIVLYCNSFSKTLVSGYRVGWVVPGKYKEIVARTKHYRSMYCSNITHEAIGNFMENGRYDMHIKKLRADIYNNYINLQRAISLYFPENTKVTHPKGGLNLWLEFDKHFNAMELYNKAIMNKISINPGRIFTLQNQYNNCIKLTFGKKWDAETEKAVKFLGKLAKDIKT